MDRTRPDRQTPNDLKKISPRLGHHRLSFDTIFRVYFGDAPLESSTLDSRATNHQRKLANSPLLPAEWRDFSIEQLLECGIIKTSDPVFGPLEDEVLLAWRIEEGVVARLAGGSH